MTASYARAFQRLHVSRSRGVAPHKPVMLLAVIDSIERGEITENKIFITPELVSLFKYIWSLLVDSTTFVPNFSLPFFHLRTEKFWHLKTVYGRDIELTSSNSIKSFSYLKGVIDYAYLDDLLFYDLLDVKLRSYYRQVLLDWFPQTKHKYVNNKVGYLLYVENFENQILHEDVVGYTGKSNEQVEEEEIFVRGGVFKKVVPRIYNYTCCISGMSVATGLPIQMIDACHIVPFSESHNDTIGNGISLCPNLHRAFDRGLISIDENYKVIVSSQFSENSESEYSIRKYQSKCIFLPTEERYRPSRENLIWHLENRLVK
jgi:putative restriction endonuclease